MDGTSTPRRGGRRRPVVVAEELEKRRTRRVERNAAARERQARIDAAEKQYTEAWAGKKVAENDLADEIGVLQQRIEEARARTAAQIAEHRRQQALAAAAIRREGCNVEELADILDVSQNEARQLLSEARSLQRPEADAVDTRQPREDHVAVESIPAANTATATGQDVTATSEPHVTRHAFESVSGELDPNDGIADRASSESPPRSLQAGIARGREPRSPR
ncbi:hypothetical protein [Nocardia sp. NPDC059691]|uniref:hypothetical protein n=1 Tax=Nocardia sp. NPDC059691 TaxID=3346908 RepID=UPI00367A6FFB